MQRLVAVNCLSNYILAFLANEAQHLLSALLQKWMKIEVQMRLFLPPEQPQL